MPHALITTQGDEFTLNTSGSLVSAASLTTTQTTSDQTNTSARGVKVVLDWLSGTGSVTLAIEAKDPTSGKYFTLLSGVAASFVATNVYTVYPGLVAAANATVNDVLPRVWRVKLTANTANPASYTVGYSLIL